MRRVRASSSSLEMSSRATPIPDTRCSGTKCSEAPACPIGARVRKKRTAILIPLFTSVSRPAVAFPTGPRQVLKSGGTRTDMKIVSLEALIVRIPRNQRGADRLETLLARVITDSGLTGWGESQALAAPEVASAIIHSILKPALKGKECGGTGQEIETLWDAMYDRMRVSGQTGGFMLDAMAAVDIALWDLAGK